MSRYTGVSLEELRALNPQYRADFIPGEEGAYPLCLPTERMSDLINWADTMFAATADSLAHAGKAAIPQVRASKTSAPGSGMYHKVRRGETLSSIASKHGTTVQRLKKLNGLKSDKIREGQRLRVR